MKLTVRTFISHTLCGLAGFILATAVIANQGQPGVVTSPDSYYQDGRLTAVQNGALTDYEIASPHSQLKLVEFDGNEKGRAGMVDIWLVSCMNGSAPPEIDAPLGFICGYTDTDNNQSPDEMNLYVGTESYQYGIYRSERNQTSERGNREWFSIYRSNQRYTTYYDFDKNGFFDLVREGNDLTLDREDPDYTDHQWVVWERRMYPVRQTHEAPTGATLEIEDTDGSIRFVRMSDRVWKETTLP